MGDISESGVGLRLSVFLSLWNAFEVPPTHARLDLTRLGSTAVFVLCSMCSNKRASRTTNNTLQPHAAPPAVLHTLVPPETHDAYTQRVG